MRLTHKKPRPHGAPQDVIGHERAQDGIGRLRSENWNPVVFRSGRTGPDAKCELDVTLLPSASERTATAVPYMRGAASVGKDIH